jgi:HSP20 family protein
VGNHSRREPGAWVPAADIEQTEDAIVFKLDMPSTTKDDISIELHGRTLAISGERYPEHEQSHEGFLSRERSFGRFSRSFLLPEDVGEDDITATFADGELKVTVPRPRVETPRTIEITGS